MKRRIDQKNLLNAFEQGTGAEGKNWTRLLAIYKEGRLLGLKREKGYGADSVQILAFSTRSIHIQVLLTFSISPGGGGSAQNEIALFKRTQNTYR